MCFFSSFTPKPLRADKNNPVLNSTRYLSNKSFVIRSVLLNIQTSPLFLSKILSTSSESISTCVISHTTHVMSAFLICSLARRIPSFSTLSTDSRTPAVSTMVIGTPSTWIIASKRSLVVPGSLFTIARSYPTRELKRVDFPEFVGPAKTTMAPEVMMRHVLYVFSKFCNIFCVFSVLSIIYEISTLVMSSSETSNKCSE